MVLADPYAQRDYYPHAGGGSPTRKFSRWRGGVRAPFIRHPSSGEDEPPEHQVPKTSRAYIQESRRAVGNETPALLTRDVLIHLLLPRCY